MQRVRVRNCSDNDPDVISSNTGMIVNLIKSSWLVLHIFV